MLKIVEKTYSFIIDTFNRVVNNRMRLSLLQAIPFWIASIMTGIATVIYTLLFSKAEGVMHSLMELHTWSLYVQMPIFMFFAWWIVYKYAAFSRGSGIPQVMASIEIVTKDSTRDISPLLSLKVALIKIFSSILMVCGGGAIGREGPTIQISASIFNFVNNYIPKTWPKLKPANMIIGGAAAGLAAAFNTPLGGIVFAVEELSKTHVSFYRTALFSAVIISGLTAQGILGPYLYLGYPDVKNISWHIIPYVVVVAILGGIFAAYFAKAIKLMLAYKKKSINTVAKNILYILVIATALASWAIFINNGILGSGKELMQHLLFTNEKQIIWYEFPQRFIGPVLSFTIGAAGGIFAPSLGAGAALGSFIASIFHLGLPETNLIILAGMVAFLTGLTRSPFTSAILVLEMTDRHSVIFYLMLAGTLASVSALLIDRKSFYEHLKTDYITAFEKYEDKMVLTNK